MKIRIDEQLRIFRAIRRGREEHIGYVSQGIGFLFRDIAGAEKHFIMDQTGCHEKFVIAKRIKRGRKYVDAPTAQVYRGLNCPDDESTKKQSTEKPVVFRV